MPLSPSVVHALPAVDAVLNSAATVLLFVGHSKIKQGKIEEHKRLMVSAFVVSMVFLTCYLTYHYEAGVIYFTRQGIVRTAYLWILTTHTILAAIIPFLATITLYFGLKRRDRKHRKIARWTYPMWLYVSITGVIVYLLLYQVQPRL